MAMRGIDISNWDYGIELSCIDYDFVIAKVTQGTTYRDAYCDSYIARAREMGKCWGVYHYIDGSGAEAEAEYFVSQCRAAGYLGAGILVLDWESIQNRAWQDESYLEAVIEAVKAKCGITPLVYASASVFPWEVCDRQECGTWVAQYADEEPTGYQDFPWNEDAYTCDIRQYASSGHLDGFTGALDLDKAYMTAEQWARFANPAGGNANNTPANCKTVTEMALEVARGVYGDGDTRRAALGAMYDQVQAEVNRLYWLADKVINGDYGNGGARKAALGGDYEAVQTVVNIILA